MPSPRERMAEARAMMDDDPELAGWTSFSPGVSSRMYAPRDLDYASSMGLSEEELLDVMARMDRVRSEPEIPADAPVAEAYDAPFNDQVAEGLRSGLEGLGVPRTTQLGARDAARLGMSMLPTEMEVDYGNMRGNFAQGDYGAAALDAGMLAMGAIPGAAAGARNIKKVVNPSGLGSGYGDRVKYEDPDTGSYMEIVERIGAPRDASVLDLNVPEEHRGKGIGSMLQERVLADNPSLMGQIHSKAAAKIAYRAGRRPFDKPDATLEDVFKIIDDDSSVNMLTPEMTKRIKAFHGSPHDFDKFSMDAIGTGEGAQAYGHGLYFAENPDVAKTYSPRDFDHEEWMLKKYNEAAESGDYYAADAWELAMMHETPWDIMERASDPDYDEYSQEAFRTVANMLEENPPKTKFMEVEINADPENFLDWDAPLSEQSDAVKRAIGFDALPKKPTPEEAKTIFDLARERGVPAHTLPEYKALEARMDAANTTAFDSLGIGRMNVPIEPQNITGANLYSGMEDQLGGIDWPVGADLAQRQEFRKQGASKAADALREKGISGIKYFDQSSRTDGAGTRNFVVFDENTINIVRKYGIAGALSLGLISQEVATQMAEQQEAGVY